MQGGNDSLPPQAGAADKLFPFLRARQIITAPCGHLAHFAVPQTRTNTGFSSRSKRQIKPPRDNGTAYPSNAISARLRGYTPLILRPFS